jgi:hypothetical protein
LDRVRQLSQLAIHIRRDHRHRKFNRLEELTYCRAAPPGQDTPVGKMDLDILPHFNETKLKIGVHGT